MKSKIYRWSLQRNKNSKGNSQAQKKKELLESLEIPKREWHKYELEHLVPVFIGGHVFEGDNISIMSKKAHKEKTQFDKAFIHFLKKADIIRDGNDVDSPIHPDSLSQLYRFAYGLHSEAKRKWKPWDNHIPDQEKEYEFVRYDSNKKEVVGDDRR